MKKAQRPDQRRFLMAVLFAAFVFNTNQALGLCLIGEANPAQGEEPFRFTMALAESFSYAKSALEKGSKSTTDLSDMIYQLKSAEGEYKCAADLMADFSKSKDEKIQLSGDCPIVRRK